MTDWPIHSWIGVNHSDWTVRAAKFFHVPICWTHCYLVFEMADASLVVYEADWRGVGPDKWDGAHRADGWAWFRDDRQTAETVQELWAFSQGSRGKIYDWPLLVKVAARIILRAWGLLRGLTWAEAGMAQVCSSFVSAASEAVYGEPYVDRDDPSPDEIVANEHLHFYEGGGD